MRRGTMVIGAPAATESDLVQRAQNGDRAAFQELYETYLPRIYDFVGGMLRNRADAEDATSETFLKAVERLGDLREPAAFKGWLYTIARNAALRIVEGRKRATPVGEHVESANTVEITIGPSPEEQAERSELRALFDEAAATLSERDRTVFELTMRHGMSSAEIAKVLRVRPAYAYILVNRLKASVIEAVETVVLARTGSECPGLRSLLERSGSEATPRMRKAVARHARSCSTCAETKRRRAALPVLLQGIAFAEPSATFAAQLTSQIDARWNAPSVGDTSESSTGRTFAHIAAGAALVLVLAVAVGGFAAQRTLVPEEEGPVDRTSERVLAPDPETIESDPPGVQVVGRVAPPLREGAPDTVRRPSGRASVDFENGSPDADPSSGDSSVTGDEDSDSASGADPGDQPQGPSAGSPNSPSNPNP